MDALTAFAGSIPANYDRYLGPVLFEPYALDMVARLKRDTVKNLLEISSGTGRVTAHLVSLIPEDGSFIASDINSDMLEVAKSKITDPVVQWKIADAQQLPFDNESFDHVVCQFGIMFFPDKQKALEEAYRVLEKGGKYLFNTWDSLDYNPRVAIFRNVMMEMFGNDTPDFLGEGPFSFHDKDEIRNMLVKAGFRDVRITEVPVISRYESEDNFIKGFLSGPLGAYIAEKSEEIKLELNRRVKENMSRHTDYYGPEFPLQAIVCEGIR